MDKVRTQYILDHYKKSAEMYEPYLKEFEKRLLYKIRYENIDDQFNYDQFKKNIYIISDKLRFQFLPYGKLEFFFTGMHGRTLEIPEEYQKVKAFYKEFRTYKRTILSVMGKRANTVNKGTEMAKFRENLNNKLNKNLHDVTKFLDVFFTDVCQINKHFYQNNRTINNANHKRFMKKISEFIIKLIKKTKS